MLSSCEGVECEQINSHWLKPPYIYVIFIEAQALLLWFEYDFPSYVWKLTENLKRPNKILLKTKNSFTFFLTKNETMEVFRYMYLHTYIHTWVLGSPVGCWGGRSLSRWHLNTWEIFVFAKIPGLYHLVTIISRMYIIYGGVYILFFIYVLLFIFKNVAPP